MDEFDKALADYSDYRNNRSQMKSETKRLLERLDKAKKFMDETPQKLRNYEREFDEKTGLNAFEIKLLFVVAGLQVLRQYWFKFPIRLNDQDAAKSTDGYMKTHSNRVHKYYNPGLEEIITNPVPFDANIGSDGALKGGGKLGHRVKTLGHDPILGLIFGTANIATATLTTNEFKSYHIKTRDGKDVFAERADTSMVLTKTIEKLLGPKQEREKVAIAFVKELVHLKSDMYTKNGLPLPGISIIDAKLASKLSDYGFDFANISNITQQATWASFINYLTAIYHYSFYDGTISEDLYEVKTKKIIMYSGALSSLVNVAVVAITKDIKRLDIGGIGVAIYTILKDRERIREIKRDYVLGNYDNELKSL